MKTLSQLKQKTNSVFLKEIILDYGIDAILNELIDLLELNHSNHPDCPIALDYLIKAKQHIRFISYREKVQLKKNPLSFDSVEVSNG
jgi:hypothetical protein